MLPKDSHVTAPREIKRLTAQNARIFARLCAGPATRRELGELALNVTARISDIRDYLEPLGQTVSCQEHPNGLSVYRLVSVPKASEGPSQGHDLNRTWNLT